MFKFKKVAVGGAFDHFHLGHQQLLKTALAVSEKVIIGISSEKMVKKKRLPRLIEPWGRRHDSVLDFLKKKHWQRRAEILVLEKPAGPVLDDVSIEAVVVSPQTKDKAQFLLKRQRQELSIVVCPAVYSTDKKYISATRIRCGEIDRNGQVFLDLNRPRLENSTNGRGSSLPGKLPAGLRDELKKPLGKLWKRSGELIKSLNKQPPTVLIAVGDVVSQSVINSQILPRLLIVDGLVGRCRVGQVQYGKALEMTVVKNPASTVTTAMVAAIKQRLGQLIDRQKQLCIKVDGEEDLAVIPAVLAAPLGSAVLYGQPKKGVVEVKVGEKSKARFYRLWQRFKTSDVICARIPRSYEAERANELAEGYFVATK